MLSAIANIAVPRPNAVPFPKYDNISPNPIANIDMKKYTGKVKV